MIRLTKDPDEDLDYKWEWDDWLPEGYVIDTINLIAPAGITVHDESKVDGNTNVVAWVSGGTVGEEYTVTCRITTNAPAPFHIADRSIIFVIEEK